MASFGESDREKDARDNDDNVRLFKQQAYALGRKLLNTAEPISQQELDAFRETRDNIIACCDRYLAVEGSAELKEKTMRAFLIVYPKAKSMAQGSRL